MAGSTFNQQLKALVRRNFTLKCQNLLITCAELVLPILAIIMALPQIRHQEKQPIPVFIPIEMQVCLYPEEKDVRTIGELFKNNFQKDLISMVNITFLQSSQYSDNVTFKLRTGDCDVVALFKHNVRHSGSYEIRILKKTKEIGFDFAHLNQHRNDSLLLTFKRAVDTALIQFWSQNSYLDLQKPLMSLVSAPGIQEELSLSEKRKTVLLPIYLILGYSFLISTLCLNIVQEKERKIKETNVIMGLSISAYWTAWFLTEFAIVFTLSVLQVLVLHFSVFPNTNIGILFVVFLLFGCSIIVLAFLMTSFFQSSKTAASISSFVSVLTSLFYLMAIFTSDVMSRKMYFLVSILSPSAITLAIQKICEFNIKGSFRYHNLFEGKFSVADAMLMVVIDIVVYALLTYILDNILSEETLGFRGMNVRRWFSKSARSRQSQDGSYSVDITEEQVDVEPQEDTAKESIKLLSVRKIYNPGKKNQTKAVDGLTLDIYKGQITALLGHNGAGKTTLIKLLTGTVKATSGEIRVGQDNIRPDDYLYFMRDQCGVCPQENILFDQLSARQHLIFYGEFKGFSKQDHAAAMINIMTSLELTKFMDRPMKFLSGAEKRKICLAIALMVMPKFLFLDEPTSGLDPEAKRKVWSVLRNLASRDRTIILTTHDMEEADILADRKAIISKGKLRCVGSSMYLKSKFGIGYHLRMSINSSCDATAVLSRIQKHNSKAISTRQSANEMKVILPSMETSQMTTLLLDLENSASNLGVLNYRISLPTLEEVFYKLEESFEGSDVEKHLDDAHEEIPLQQDDIDNNNLFHAKQEPSSLSIFIAFLKIRFLLVSRYPSHVFAALTLPLLYVSFAIFFNKILGVFQKLKDNEVDLSTDIYTRRVFSIENNTGHDIENVVKTLKSYDFSLMNDINDLSKNDFLVEIMLWSYNVSLKTVDISWQWTFYPFHQFTQLTTLNLMSNVIWSSINKQNESQYLSTSLREVGIENVNPINVALIETLGTLFSMALGLIHVICLIAIEALCDKKENARNQLYISGLNGWSYWLPILLAHTIFVIFIIVLMAILATVTHVSLFQEHTSAKLIFWAVMFLNIPALLLYVYAFSYCFDSHNTAYAILPTIFLWLMVLVIFLSLNFGKFSCLFYFFMYLICPFFTPLGTGMLLIRKVMWNDVENSYTTATALVAIMLNTLLYAVILKSVDTYGCKHTSVKEPVKQSDIDFPEEDDDVRTERENISSISNFDENQQQDVLRIKNLTKIYISKDNCLCKKSDSKTVIKSLSFSVKRGEIFGFLGPIGSGKTSTVKIITGEEKATSGEIFIENKQVTGIMSHAPMDIGYCSQQEGLWKRITVEEHLKFYSILKGITLEHRSEFCERVMEILDIKGHRNKKVKDLSGGTKRKLSCLLSMFGNPKLLILDDPSSGIDPISKRKLWNFLRSQFSPDAPNAALITTHSIAEAEAICTKIGIMVNGTLRCLGPVQHLKNKYGDGYVLQFKLSMDLSESDKSKLKEKLEEFVNATFPKAKAKTSSGVCLSYSVPKETVFSLADAFQALETAKREHQFPDYTFSQSTLEQVFLELTKEQEVHLKK